MAVDHREQVRHPAAVAVDDHQRLLVVEHDVRQRVVVPLQPAGVGAPPRGRRGGEPGLLERGHLLDDRPVVAVRPGRLRPGGDGGRPLGPEARREVDVQVAQLQRLGDDEVLDLRAVGEPRPLGPLRLVQAQGQVHPREQHHAVVLVTAAGPSAGDGVLGAVRDVAQGLAQPRGGGAGPGRRGGAGPAQRVVTDLRGRDGHARDGLAGARIQHGDLGGQDVRHATPYPRS